MAASTSTPKTTLKVVLGTMNMGKEGAPMARVHDLPSCGALLDTFQSYGHTEIDTARLYGFGSTEEYLTQLDWATRGLSIGTKLSPKKIGPKPYSHKAEDLRRGILASKEALKTDKLDLFYLHMPDHQTSYAETLAAITELHKEGHFSRFGICNFAAWEVSQICELAAANNWKKPDVYQSSYNAFHRSADTELVPCLKKYNISYYVFSPLAGGMLTGKYDRQGGGEEGGRFDANVKGGFYRKQYWNEPSFQALDVLAPVLKKHDIATSEAALRWLSHHSGLSGEKGDAVIIGATRPEQLQSTLAALEKDALPEEVVQAFEEAWGLLKASAVPYFA